MARRTICAGCARAVTPGSDSRWRERDKGNGRTNTTLAARTLKEYTEAVLRHTRGEHDAGGKIIHETSKEKRQEFAAEIWRRRRTRGTDRRP